MSLTREEAHCGHYQQFVVVLKLLTTYVYLS